MSQCTSIPAPSTAYLSTLSLHDALPICRIASLVAKRPQAIWIGLVIVLALPLLAAPQFKASGVAQSEFVLGDSEARDGQDVLSAHFPGGSGSPTQVVVSADELDSAAQALGEPDGGESVSVTTEDSPSGTAKIGRASCREG